MNINKTRKYFAALSAILLTAEIFIALFVRDSFIRPYGGDILVTVLLCCIVRTVFPKGIKYLPVWIFLFAAAVETAQYYDIVSLMGLSHIPFFNILIGSVFSWEDIVCYGVGCAVFYTAEKYLIKTYKER